MLYNADCFDVFSVIPDGSVDLVLTDPPYGTTACKWDSVIPFEPMWKELNRITKKDGAIVLFGSEPFSSMLRASNIKKYKYDFYWKKNRATGFANAKKQPLRNIEIISVFYDKCRYNPQGLIRVDRVMRNSISAGGQVVRADVEASKGKGVLRTAGAEYVQEFTNYPTQVLEFVGEQGHHPTQKPVGLLEYLIKTYTQEGETVLDFTMGSGSTGVAAANTKRRFIGIEKDTAYYTVAANRIYEALLCS